MCELFDSTSQEGDNVKFINQSGKQANSPDSQAIAASNSIKADQLMKELFGSRISDEEQDAKKTKK